MNLNKAVKFLLEAQVQFKICHWQTKSFAQHNAFGGIYDALDDLIDKFVEVAMGKYGRFELSDKEKSIKIENLGSLNINLFLKEVIRILSDFDKALTEKDKDLLNIRDEMLAEANKLAYLLTLE
jgi:hypothetical protein